MMWIGGLFISDAKESVEMMHEFKKPFIVDSGKFETTFGMKATPMKETINENHKICSKDLNRKECRRVIFNEYGFLFGNSFLLDTTGA